MLCVTASNNILENANREKDMLCVTTAELHEELQDEDMLYFFFFFFFFFEDIFFDEDMLCFTASLIVKKI